MRSRVEKCKVEWRRMQWCEEELSGVGWLPMAFLRCIVVAWQRSAPWCSAATRSPSASASSMKCVVSSTVRDPRRLCTHTHTPRLKPATVNTINDFTTKSWGRDLVYHFVIFILHEYTYSIRYKFCNGGGIF